MMTQKALETAQRNLAQRIGRWLDAMGERQPSFLEGDQLLKALTHLEARSYPEGETAMMWADWASRQSALEGSDFAEAHPRATPAILRTRFNAIRTSDE